MQRFRVISVSMILTIAWPLSARADQVVEMYSGNGAKQTRPFTVGDGWQLRWSANGAIFQIYLHTTDGAITSVPANQVGAGHGSSYQPKGGTYFLQVNALGKWSVSVVQISKRSSDASQTATTLDQALEKFPISPAVDKKKGFRGIAFGSSLASRSDLEPSGKKAGLEAYTRLKEKMSIGTHTILGVVYLADSSGFQGAMILIAGNDNCTGVADVFKSAFGDPSGSEDGLVIWLGRKNVATVVSDSGQCVAIVGRRKLITIIEGAQKTSPKVPDPGVKDL